MLPVPNSFTPSPSSPSLFMFQFLKSNHIVHLPKEIGSLARLKTLDVSNNDLPELPAALGYLPELHRLIVDGNPLRTVRRSLLSGGASSLKVRACLRVSCVGYKDLLAAGQSQLRGCVRACVREIVADWMLGFGCS